MKISLVHTNGKKECSYYLSYYDAIVINPYTSSGIRYNMYPLKHRKIILKYSSALYSEPLSI
jgi:hypothetical protein